jgi:DNA (cytosine-5)-methyltransferase 1
MARAGLGPSWTCLFANDFDAKKGAAYAGNWGADDLRIGDIHGMKSGDLAGRADLAWASFPCQDLSLAGAQAGLKGVRSGAFYGFRDLVAGLAREGRAPRILALENVVGALTSNKGADFVALCTELRNLGYVFGAMTIDAARFVPQSRPRLFVIAVRREITLCPSLICDFPHADFTSSALLRAYELTPENMRRDWRWWALPAPAGSNLRLIDLIEASPADVDWHSDAQTQKLMSLMDGVNRAKLDAALQSGERSIGAVYRRTRMDAAGKKVQRAEVRFDGLAGCLRTPGGGSSRQFILVVEHGAVRSRLLSGREAARLMGLPDDFALPQRYSDALHLLGDGVAPPVVRHLAQHLFAPLLAAGARADAAANAAE